MAYAIRELNAHVAQMEARALKAERNEDTMVSRIVAMIKHRYGGLDDVQRPDISRLVDAIEAGQW